MVVMKSKIIKRFLAVILLIGIFAGCKRDTKTTDIIGKYILAKIEKDNTSILEDEIKNSDVTGFIIFNENGTGTFMMLNDRLPFTWKDGKITGGDQTISYELDGDKLTLIISATEKIYLQREK